MFTFCPLQGARSESTASQSLLELDGGVKVLIDVGWDESFDAEKLKELEKQVPTISLILLTHATVSHIAAFAHCCKNFPQFVRIPIFATKPVIDLGRTLLQDLYASTPLAATTVPRSSLTEVSYSLSQSLSSDSNNNFLLQPPTPDEITRYFSLIRELKYSQPHQPQAPPNLPPLNGLTITAYNSGRTLGGTIWHIQLGLESIVYGVDWGQYKENVFAGAAWIGGAHGGGSEVIEQLRKPTALVSSSRSPQVLRPGLRDDKLLETIRNCVARGGTVLIPVDSSARVLELAYLLEHAWRKDAAAPGGDGLSKAKLYLSGRTSGSLIRHARTLLEWMNDGIVQEFEAVADGSGQANGRGGRGGGGDDGKGREAGPFELRHLRLLERRAQVDKVLSSQNTSTGKVILASDASLEWGFSKEILRKIADDPQNVVILTEVPGFLSDNKTSLARTLWDWWGNDENGSELVSGNGRPLRFHDAKKVALDGDELSLYQQWLATKRQLQATVQIGGAASLEPFADAGDDVSSESSSDSEEESDSEQQGKVLNTSTTIGQASRKKVLLKDEDLGVSILIKRKGHYDFDVRGKKGRDRMFPLTVRRKRNDDFGELIRPDEYLREEEREEDNNETGQGGNAGGNQQDGLGKKRKFDDVDASPNGKGGPGGGGGGGGNWSNKRGHHHNQQFGRGGGNNADDLAMASGDSDAGVAEDELDMAEDKEEEPIVGPSKLVFSTETVSANLRIAYVDFSGLHTDRNLEILLPLVEPRKLILVGGSDEETEAVADQYRNSVSRNRGVDRDDVDVFLPAVGSFVDASVDTNAWEVKLADALVKKLKWQNLRGLSIATMTGQLHPGIRRLLVAAATAAAAGNQEVGDALLPVAAPAATGEVVLPTLDVLPSSLFAAARAGSQPLHVGELRLADLRRTMQSSGHTAEFRGEGTLVIDGTVAVKKTTTGRVDVESIALPSDSGPATKKGGTFYAVKRAIYDSLAVVAGG